MASERKLRQPQAPNLFHGVEYPLTLWFYEDCFRRELEDGEEIGIQKVTLKERPKYWMNVPHAILYWIIGPDGVGSVHSLGQGRKPR